MKKLLREKNYQKLKNKIICGDLKPGVRLTERELIPLLNTSKTPIRESLRQLESEGFVEIIPNKGARVANISVDKLINIYDILAALEGMSVEISTPTMTSNDIKTLWKMHDEMQKIDSNKDPGTYVKLNNKFHCFFAQKSNNNKLHHLIIDFGLQVTRYRVIISTIQGTQKQYHNQHESLLLAVEKRDSVIAGNLMKEHVLKAKNNLVNYLNKIPSF